jgi:hypothetical protein
MLKRVIFAAALGAAFSAGPAVAASWGVGVGVGFGPPVFYEPPIFYDVPPPVYYGDPVEEAPVLHMEAPEDVFDRLDAAGYREFGPMQLFGNQYRLSAIAPDGDLVALEISIFSGEIDRVMVLEEGVRAPIIAGPLPSRAPIIARTPVPRPAAAMAAPPAPASAAPPASASAPPAATPPPSAVSPEEVDPDAAEGDPLVVY